MASTDFKKIHTDKREKFRDLNDVRTRTSQRVKNTRKLNRETALNLHRHVEVIPEVKSKMTEVEEKLFRLKVYKAEKVKKMEEQKKKIKPPFYNLVKTRHTGGTPFRNANQPKIPVFNLPPTTRSRTQMQRHFEFKATLNDAEIPVNSKKQNTCKTKTVPVKHALAKDKENQQPAKNKETQQAVINAKNLSKEKLLKNVKPTSANAKVAPAADERSTRNKKNQLENNVADSKKPKNNPVTKNKKVINKRTPATKLVAQKSFDKKSKSAENSAVSSKEHSPRVQSAFSSKEHSPRVQSAGELNNIENKMEEVNNVLMERLNEPMITMSPVLENSSLRRSARRRLRTLNGNTPPLNGLICKEETSKSRNKKKSQEELITDVQNESSKHEENLGQELRSKLNEETARMNGVADVWSKFTNDDCIPGQVQDEIFAVVGQTRLLLSDKFQQFKALLDNAESNSASSENPALIKSGDLLGFWEMMFIQVEQLNQKYENLEELKNNNWQPCEKIVIVKKNRKKNKKVPAKSASSKLKEFLKKKKEENSNIEKINNQNNDVTFNVDNEQSVMSTRSSLGLLPDSPFINTPTINRIRRSERKSRRSSVITLKKCFLAKAVSSPFKIVD